MKEFILSEHSNLCGFSSEANQTYCERYMSKFLFFGGWDFYLVHYHKCTESYNYLDFYRDLIRGAYEGSKILRKFRTYRTDLNEELKESRLRGVRLRKHITQVNFIYCNSARKEFAICTEADFMETICNMERVTENYLAAKKYLYEKGEESMLDQLLELYVNNFYLLDDVEVIRSVDNLIDKINQIINNNGNNEKSQHKRIAETRL